MKKIRIYQVDAFTKSAFGGNPAGVVPDAAGLSDIEMQRIAREMNCSETAFVLPSSIEGADLRIRFFTPSAEVDLCGHATIAVFHVLASEGRICAEVNEAVVMQETRAGLLAVKIVKDGAGQVSRVVMDQKLPEILGAFDGKDEIDELAGIMGLESSDLILRGLPVRIVSTGLPDLMIPVRDLKTLQKAAPDFQRMARFQKARGIISMHAFTFETVREGNDLHVRDFAPSVEIDEEAATGTANGALAAYLALNKAVLPDADGLIRLRIEQGHVMDRPSEIIAEAVLAGGAVTSVRVGGSAAIVLEGIMSF